MKLTGVWITAPALAGLLPCTSSVQTRRAFCEEIIVRPITLHRMRLVHPAAFGIGAKENALE